MKAVFEVCALIFLVGSALIMIGLLTVNNLWKAQKELDSLINRGIRTGTLVNAAIEARNNALVEFVGILTLYLGLFTWFCAYLLPEPTKKERQNLELEKSC